jgi:hypothetical protein
MSSSLSPEERRRIEEEQKIRDKTQMKTAFKYLGIAMLVAGLIFICVIATIFGGISSIFGG